MARSIGITRSGAQVDRYRRRDAARGLASVPVIAARASSASSLLLASRSRAVRAALRSPAVAISYLPSFRSRLAFRDGSQPQTYSGWAFLKRSVRAMPLELALYFRYVASLRSCRSDAVRTCLIVSPLASSLGIRIPARPSFRKPSGLSSISGYLLRHTGPRRSRRLVSSVSGRAQSTQRACSSAKRSPHLSIPSATIAARAASEVERAIRSGPPRPPIIRLTKRILGLRVPSVTYQKSRSLFPVRLSVA